MKIGDLLLKQGIQLSLDEEVRHFHTKVFIPDWYEEYFKSFDSQTIKMSSPKKPFKATDYFKIKAGYPHEVMRDNKAKLLSSGCSRDRLSNKAKVTIPKLTLEKYNKIKKNLVAFTSPMAKHFIRDITVYDAESHNTLVYVYVISRKAQIITAWCEPKIGGEYIIKKPKNLIKSLQYQIE
jgi:hypothetical protein|tara:strand:- start:762 stop:1301 length:540 start_codon:yes stop_codon:yes gene_type:complete